MNIDSTYDFIDESDRMKVFTFDFVLDPERWQNFKPLTMLKLKSVKFEENNLDAIPKTIGIYAFVIKFYSIPADEKNFPSHGFIMYGGITGYKKNSTRCLRDRFKEYLSGKDKRPRIINLFKKFHNHLYFFYSETPPDIDLTVLEHQFNDAIQPPAVQNDFSADVRASRTAAF